MRIFRLTLKVVILLLLTLSVSPARAALDEPPKMMGQRMVYDPATNRVLLFGGTNNNSSYILYGDTLALNVANASWRKLVTNGSPSPRFNMGLTYDSDTKKIVLFGGVSGSGRVGDTWIYEVSLSTWTNANPSNYPSSRSDATLSYDASAKKIVLFGGYGYDEGLLGDTWTYDVSGNTWTKMSPETSPVARYGATMVYDTYTGRTLLFGGHLATGGYDNEVWANSYASDSWEKLTVSNKPATRHWHDAVYDLKLNRMIIFGGKGAGDVTFDDTWVYNCRNQTWSRVSLEVHPEGREFPSLAYNASSGKVVLFGGVKLNGKPTSIYYNGTWSFDQIGGWGRLVAESAKPQSDQSTVVPGYPFLAVLIGALLSVYLIRRNLKSISTAERSNPRFS